MPSPASRRLVASALLSNNNTKEEKKVPREAASCSLSLSLSFGRAFDRSPDRSRRARARAWLASSSVAGIRSRPSRARSVLCDTPGAAGLLLLLLVLLLLLMLLLYPLGRKRAHTRFGSLGNAQSANMISSAAIPRKVVTRAQRRTSAQHAAPPRSIWRVPCRPPAPKARELASKAFQATTALAEHARPGPDRRQRKKKDEFLATRKTPNTPGRHRGSYAHRLALTQ